MKMKLLTPLLLVVLWPLLPAIAEPILQVRFVPDKYAETNGQDGFQNFLVPMENEMTPAPPLVTKFGDISVSISGAAEKLPSRFPDAPGRLITRIRAVGAEEKKFAYYQLYRCWVGAPKILTIQLAGLKGSTSYSVRFFAYDYSEAGSSRSGSIKACNARDPQGATALIEWNPSSSPEGATPLEKQSAPLKTLSTPEGQMLLAIESETKLNPILNGFILEEVN